MTLSPADKADLIAQLTSLNYAPDALNLLITRAVQQAQTLADVHYALSAYAQVIKAANQRVAEMMEAVEHNRT